MYSGTGAAVAAFLAGVVFEWQFLPVWSIAMVSYLSRVGDLIRKAVSPQPVGRRRWIRHRLEQVGLEVNSLESRRVLSVTYHGGALLTNVEAQAVYVGSDWQTSSSLHAQTNDIDQFMSSLVNGSYMDMLTQAGYNTGRGTASPGAVDNLAINKSTGITDTQIHQQLQAMINSGSLHAPDTNQLYVVYTEPGVVVTDGSASSSRSFLGYHGAFAGKTAGGTPVDIHYAVVAYPGTPNASPTSQGFATVFDQLTSVTSHELAEAVTDPNVNYKAAGWYDDRLNGEIGDLTRINTVLNGYVVQDVVNKLDQPISPTSGTPNVPTPPVVPTPTSTITAPQNVNVKAISGTVAQLTWDAVSGAQAYRVYQIVGSQALFLGAVNGSTTAVRITGLTAGATESFRVQAVNSMGVADSPVVSVLMPSVPQHSGLTAPDVTVQLLSPTSASLNWTTVAGAAGYRIYLMRGNHRYLLGVVGASSVSVQIVGLQPGATTTFVVEAFSSNTVADSAPVSVVTTSQTATDLFQRRNRWNA